MLSKISLAHAEATTGPAVWATFQRQKLRLWGYVVLLRLWTVAALSDRRLCSVGDSGMCLRADAMLVAPLAGILVALGALQHASAEEHLTGLGA